ncbi:dynamin family protein [Actinocorallia longicatena]|uniref:Dynamin N-terminal domain-containing protein n=1 Tax=Actinocorallia longicatena TaxID=111803 RepID=A0ABP6QHE4_9ACTN
MNELQALGAAILDAFPQVLQAVGDDLTGARRSLLEDGRRLLESGRYNVVVCGEFGRGKSSLLNTLVGRPGLFPVDTAATTSVITILRWDERERAVVTFLEGPDGNAPEPLEIPLSSVASYATEQGNPENREGVLQIEMTAPIEELRGGLVLVDTPGTGSTDPGHTAATRAFLPSADAILFVATASESLSQVELDFLKLALEQCPTVVTAITMIDREEDPGPAIGRARARIGAVAGVPPEELVVVGVSAHRKRRALTRGDAGLLDRSGFPDLDRALWEGLTMTCGRARAERALDALDTALAEAFAPLANELAALHDDTAFQRVDAELRRARERSRELSSQGSRWRSDLRVDLDTAARGIRARMQDDFDAVTDDLRTALESEIAFTDPGRLVGDVSAGLIDTVNRAGIALAERAVELADRYSERTMTRLTASDVPAGPAPVLKSVREAPARPRQGPSRFARLRELMAGGNAIRGPAAIIGGAIGLAVPGVGVVVGVGVGGAIGQIVGWLGGHREMARKRRELARHEQLEHLRGELGLMVGAARRKAERDFTEQVARCREVLVKELERELEAAEQSQQRSILRLTELRESGGRRRGAHSAELGVQAERYAVLRRRLGALRERTAALDPAAGARPPRGE